MGERAFTGFVALPTPKSPWEVIVVARTASRAEIDAAYRAKAKRLQTEYGSGADVMMADLNAARAKLKGQAT